MKKSRILYLFAFFALSAWLTPPASAQPGVAVNFQTFYNELSPYGRWTSHPQYGSIWTPYNVDRDFQPYATNGQWMMTEYGNTWVSDYDWGWAPFHYGRWFYEDYYGWAWVPDYQWGPAWVDWRSGGGYYGWAPMWPGVRVGVSFNIPFNFWVFVPQRYVYRPRVFGFCVYGNRYRNVYNRTTIINNYYHNDNRVYAYGPRRSEIEQVTRGSVPVYRADEIRGSRYASASRQNSDGSYRANGNSESGLYRQDRGESNAISNRSGRQSAEANSEGTSNRSSYDAGTSSRSRGSYEADSPSGSSRSYESSAPAASSRSYESGEPSSRARSSASSPSSSTYSAPESRSSVESPSSRARSSASSPASRSYSTPESRSSSPSSRARSMESAPSRGNSSYSQPSRSSSPRMEAPASRSRSSEASPRSSSSSSSSSSSRSRGPR